MVDLVLSMTMLWGALSFHGIDFDFQHRVHFAVSVMAYWHIFSGVYSPWVYHQAKLGLNLVPLLLHWGILLAVVLLVDLLIGVLDALDSRVILAWSVLTPVSIVVTHFLIQTGRFQPRLLQHGVRRVAVVGINPLGYYIVEQINDRPHLKLDFAGFFDDRDPARLDLTEDASLQGKLSDLTAFVKAENIAMVCIVLPIMEHQRIVELLDSLTDTTAAVYFVPDIFVYDLMQGHVDKVAGLPAVSVFSSPFEGRMAGLVKRSFDLTVAGVALIMLSPWMLLCAVIIRMTSPGPALFRQRRYGLNGEEFAIYKFRTMDVMEDGEVIPQATEHDHRVTRFGAFLRKTSLDELPQLINVLQGTMSLVGPRPHPTAHNEHYRKLIRGYMLRHTVRPGVTGLAQVSGFRGETVNIEQMEGRVRYDLEYIRNWSLMLDVRIIVKTMLLLFGDRLAY